MADTHETIADIIAEMRGYSHGMPPSYHVTMSWADFRRMLDRFDAAHKREVQNALDAGGLVEASRHKRECGNVAKLREALNLCVDEMCARCRDLAKARGNPAPCLNGCEPVRKAKAALAEPIKNCEVGTAEELREALKKCLLYIASAESVGIGTITLNDKVKLYPKKIIKSAKEALAATKKEGGAK